MKPVYLINKVLIQPDEDNTHSDGVLVATHNTRQYHYAVTGTVLKAPDSLICQYEEFVKAKKSHSNREKAQLKNITRHSLPFLPDSIEIKEGDRVMFRYVSRVNQEKYEIPFLLLDYTDIFCILDENNTPTPINGYLLASPQIESNDIEGFVFGDTQSEHIFKIEYASKFKNKGYLTESNYIEKDAEINSLVLIKKGRYRVLNHPFHPVIDKEKVLIAFQRKDILGKFNTE